MPINLRFGCLLVLMSLLSACSTPAVDPSRRSGYEKERARLAEAVRGTRVAVSGSYADEHGYCQRVMAANKVDSEVKLWNVNLVSWEQRRSDDAAISYRWVCKSIYTDKGGASAFGALLTLGALPHMSTHRLTLEVSITRNGKTLFKNQYVEQREVADNLWSPKGVERHLDMADVLIEKFVKELERDGALE